MSNQGLILTNGQQAVGAAMGFTSLGFRPAENGTITNRGVIATQGDGSAGVVMAGDGHQLINTGSSPPTAAVWTATPRAPSEGRVSWSPATTGL